MHMDVVRHFFDMDIPHRTGHVTQTMWKESAERMQRFYDQLYK